MPWFVPGKGRYGERISVPAGLLQNRQCGHALRLPALIVSTIPSIGTHIPGIPGAKLPGTKEKWR
jgi:hypothetical protein